MDWWFLRVYAIKNEPLLQASDLLKLKSSQFTERTKRMKPINVHKNGKWKIFPKLIWIKNYSKLKVVWPLFIMPFNTISTNEHFHRIWMSFTMASSYWVMRYFWKKKIVKTNKLRDSIACPHVKLLEIIDTNENVLLKNCVYSERINEIDCDKKIQQQQNLSIKILTTVPRKIVKIHGKTMSWVFLTIKKCHKRTRSEKRRNTVSTETVKWEMHKCSIIT